jgi:hypothetical protein
MAANGLLRGVLGRIKQRLQAQLIADYQQWAQHQTTQGDPAMTVSTPEALKPI